MRTVMQWCGRLPAARLLPAAAILFSAWLMAAPALAQQSPTADQLEALMSLPEDEREAILRARGIDPDSLDLPGTAGAASAPPTSDALEAREGQGGDGGSGGGGEGARETLGPDDTVIVEFSRRADVESLPQFLGNLLGKRVYELDRYGILHLQNLFHIPLGGLSPEQAAARIESERGLEDMRVSLTLLPVARVGPDSLELFGRDFLSRARRLLVDPENTPIPGDYVVGPGDVIAATLFGAENERYELPVDREGLLYFPGFGPIAVSGLELSQVRQELETRVREQLIGVNVSITIQRLRAIQVFVLGEVEGPGAYTVDSMTTATNALLLSGGVKRNGSLRRVQLKRDSEVISRLDVYDLLLRGDTRNDLRLQNGDVIFVPPIGDVVGIEGEVIRPALYELRGERTVGELLDLAGGLLPEAQESTAQLERIGEDSLRTLIDLDLASEQDRGLRLRSGDVLRVAPVPDLSRGVVSLTGHVRNPRDFAWRPGLRLTDLIPSPEVLEPLADLDYLFLTRTDPAGRIEVLTPDLTRAYALPGSADDVLLAPRDEITVFEQARDRSGVIAPVLEKLDDQRALGAPLPVVTVSGQVVIPGRYPLTDGMTVADLIKAAGNLRESAYTLEAEIARRVLVGGEYARVEFIDVDLEAALAGAPSEQRPLKPHDELTIRAIPELRDVETVVLDGEVRFPGEYRLARGETLASVIERAGGLTGIAFAEGSVFTRADLRARERVQRDQLARRLEGDLAAAAVQASQSENGGDAADSLRVAQELLNQLRNTPPTGRLVIDLRKIMAAGIGAPEDVVLRNGDRLFVPQTTQEVTIIGEVQFPSSHLHAPGMERDDYIALAGGLTSQADRKRIYVVRANGEVLTASQSKWFSRTGVTVRPGDTIVVPLDADRMRPLVLWSSVTSIIYQLAIAAAAATAIGVF